MKKITFILMLIILLITVSCSKSDEAGKNVVEVENEINSSSEKNESANIYIYGEAHGNRIILEKEIELWKKYYHEDGMRHLFTEYSYFEAEYINLWMAEEDDDLLENLHFEVHNSEQYMDNKEFISIIKKECPETIFHGIDIGHFYGSIGVKYRNYLIDNNLEDSEKYLLNEEAIKQGKQFKANGSNQYREEQLVENFTREFDKLENQSVMGIFGSLHSNLDDIKRKGKTFESMGKKLSIIYEERFYTEDLSLEILKSLLDSPVSTEELQVLDMKYQASYYGKLDLTFNKNIKYIEYWKLNDAFKDFIDYKKTGNIISYNEFPMQLEINQIYLMKLTLENNTTMILYARTDEEEVDGLLVAEQIELEE